MVDWINFAFINELYHITGLVNNNMSLVEVNQAIVAWSFIIVSLV